MRVKEMEVYPLREGLFSQEDDRRIEATARLVEDEFLGRLMDADGTLFCIQMCGRIRPAVSR